jgi:hypothetical protein
VIDEIVRHSGVVLDSVPTRRESAEVNDDFERVILVSHPREFRKTNFLLALATNIPVVHHQWVRDCIHSVRLLVIDLYRLSSGCSATHACFVFPEKAAPIEGIFANLRVLNLAAGVWDGILTAGGAVLVGRDEGTVTTLGDGRGRRLAVDLVLMDPYEYSQSAMERDKTAKGKAKSRLSDAEVDLIQRCVSGEWGDSLPRAVTTDWATQCLALGRRVEVDEVDIFSPPTDPIGAPLAHKAEGGAAERYSKYDLVRYGEDRCIGKILKFVRQKSNKPLMVMIRPLFSSGGGVTGASAIKSKKHVRLQEGEGDKELTAGRDRDVMLDAKLLAGKVVVLTRADFTRLQAYTQQDPDIFYGSREWNDMLTFDRGVSRADSVSSDGESAKGSSSKNRMKLKRSQDY